MQFTTLIISALSIGSAFAKGNSGNTSTASTVASAASAASTTTTGAGITVHVMKVGSSNGSLTFSPNNIQAAVGDMVQFQFAPANHTVTQSTFDAPCQPIGANSNVTGIFSGFMPVTASATTTPTYTVMINNTTPIWLYCSQGKHCQAGMVAVINENTAKNVTRSLDNYKSIAAKASANLAPGSSSSTGTTNSGTSSSSSGGSSSGSSASTTSGVAQSTNASAATSFSASSSFTLGAVLAVAMALFV